MKLTLEQAIGQKIMIGFPGQMPSPELVALLKQQHLGGLTLFRALNVESPAQVRRLTAALQQIAATAGQPPLLIGADQEGGTLLALAETTPFPGNMALGATGSPELARQTGYAIGQELAAMGVNVNYAPVCDVLINPQNPVVGTRAFGEDPAAVARLAAAMVTGLQAAGVAATAKHFPGHGDTTADTHHGAVMSFHDEAHVRQVDLPPFAAAVQAGARLVMTAHVSVPALTGGVEVPATLSPAILRGLLRGDLGFQGVILSDALNMHAIQQGPGLAIDAIAAAMAGVDLLMLTEIGGDQQWIYAALLQAAQRGLLPMEEVYNSVERVLALKSWVGAQIQPSLEVIQSPEHTALAFEVAAQALTLVRDTSQQLPLHPPAAARLLAIVPQPEDLTPADTSSYVTPALARALRRYHPAVDELIIPMEPADADVAALSEQAARYDLVVIGTINATLHTGQAALVNQLLARGVPTVAVALRLPYDLTAYPQAPTYLCTYSILECAMDALAQALWGQRPCSGGLPVSLGDMYPLGHGRGARAS
ncbi:MAG TPA: glycoside hydrolase family 3 protein [Chloroflexia bacterium]|nr:glycoside hydrolase family 3 protein [Chloroflexia bacterium]